MHNHLCAVHVSPSSPRRALAQVAGWAIATVILAASSVSASPRARLVFASYAEGAAQAQKAQVLVRSIRSFGGVYSRAAVFIAVDESAAAVLERSGDQEQHLLRLSVPDAARRVPLAVKAYAAAQIEQAVAATADTMLWIDPESVLLAPPEELALSGSQAVAMQPVFLLNRVGLSPETPVDPYWSAIYKAAGLSETSVPTVKAVVDGNVIRFYVNCGVIAYRPSRGLCAEWARVLTSVLSDPSSRRDTNGDGLHRLFLHQAVLSAVICAHTSPAERRWIHVKSGYPLAQHDRMPADRRVARLNDVVCLIYDQAWDEDPEWLSRIPVDEPLRTWLLEAHRASFALSSRIYRQEGLCNTYLVQTGDGWVAIDPGGAEKATSPLRRFAGTDRLHAIILTHAHPDHRAGIKEWKRDRDIPVMAHRRHTELLADQDMIAGLLANRNATLTGQPRPATRPLEPTVSEVTRSFDSRHVLTYGDRHFELIPTGGETPDTTLVWIPEEKALLVADDFYSEFPNLSTLRGSKPRWALEYIAAMNTALALEPELLLPGHGEPVVGKRAIAACVTRYRDAIQYVHDAVVRGLNTDKDVYSLMRETVLPETLRLGEGFGRVSWAVRGMYESYAGWFDERTASMYSDPPWGTDAEMVALAGGPDRVAARAAALVSAGQPVMALRLTDAALAANPSHAGAIDARLAALQQLFAASTNYFERAWLQQDIRKTTAARTGGAELPRR